MNIPKPSILNRNLLILFLCQAVANTATTLVVSSTALASRSIANTPGLSTLPYSLSFVGMMALSTPTSFLMNRFGRVLGFSVGALLLSAAGALAAYSILLKDFTLFCIASVLLGGSTTFAMHYRFAAAEVVQEKDRPYAISFVVSGGLIAALIGPSVALWARDFIETSKFSGSFLMLFPMGLLTLLLLRFLTLARQDSTAGNVPPRRLPMIARQPKFLIAMLGGAIGHSTMIAGMVAAPLAMAGCGHSFGATALSIQWHFIGMYLPGFFVGHLFKVIGIPKSMLHGALIMAGSLIINLVGSSHWHFTVGLFLLGIGWSLVFPGATALLTRTYTPSERAKVQALNETVLFSFVAFGTFMSGFLQNTVGWEAVNYALFPGLALIVGTISNLLPKKPLAKKPLPKQPPPMRPPKRPPPMQPPPKQPLAKQPPPFRHGTRSA